MPAARLSRNLALMHPHLMTSMVNERSYEMRAYAARRRRGRFAQMRGRRAEARRARHPFRVAHA
jgi:hypothetical protein